MPKDAKEVQAELDAKAIEQEIKSLVAQSSAEVHQQIAMAGDPVKCAMLQAYLSTLQLEVAAVQATMIACGCP